MKKITVHLIRFLIVAGSVLYVQAAEPAQEWWINAAYVKDGVVDTGNPSAKLAVRSGPGLTFSQIDALSSGRKVNVLENKNGWVRIPADKAPAASAAPAVSKAPAAAKISTEQWVNAAYVKNGIIDTGRSDAKLAVRTGPGLSNSSIGALSSGQKVTIIEARNGWIRIEPAGAAPAKQAAAAAPAVKPARVKPLKSVPAQVPAVAVAQAVPRPVPVPVRPPVDNLILSGDFSAAALGLPSAGGDTTAELSGRWLRAASSSWEISPYGGNLGPYARAAASREAGRLLYVANDAKRSTGSYLLRFDYILADPADVLGVKVFVSDRDITIGTTGGILKMNDTQRMPDMIMLPAVTGWAAHSLAVELGSGYNFVYVLFAGSGVGNTGIDNVSLSPQRR
jgi:uncharacterized protein YraI